MILLAIWRRRKTEEIDRLISDENFFNIPHRNTYLRNHDDSVQPEIIEMTSISYKNDEDPSKHVEGRKKDRRKQLAPLIIHRNMSGQSRPENSGDVKIETPIDEKTEGEIDKNLMEKYVRFVTLDKPLSLRSSTVSEKSNPEGVPLSPRELFFIDLIQNAEKNDAKKCTDSTTKVAQFISQERTSNGIKTRTTEESYFIANVESPVINKNEIFIEIQEPQITLQSVPTDISICLDRFTENNVPNGL